MFCQQSFMNYKAFKTISSSIANTLNSRYIYHESTTLPVENDNCYKIPTPLLNKNRCIIEDVMCLPENTKVTILIPKPKPKDHLTNYQSNTYVECEKSYFQYGNEKNQGHIHSCPYETYATNNALTLQQINKALNPNRNNGYGLTCIIQQCLYSDKFSSQSSHKFRLCIKWADVLHGH